jgi:nucleoside phosphorylase
MATRTLTYQDYSIGWVCALTKELASATVMLDEKHSDLAIPQDDQNTYTFGSIGNHNIVIACLPKGDIGNNPAAVVATRMTRTFPSIKFWLMVGIAGGVPPKVRLGDIVVSTPVDEYPGVVQWDLGKAEQGSNFRRIGSLNKPPDVLRTAITKLESQHEIYGADSGLSSILDNVRSKHPNFASKYLRTNHLKDVLFQKNYHHIYRKDTPLEKEEVEMSDDDDDTSNCQYCDLTKTRWQKAPRAERKIHYGLIASGNKVIKDSNERDNINKQLGGNVLAFEMEAAGIAVSHPCLVIRGICGKVQASLSLSIALIEPTRLF